ncbi:MAG: pyrroline-5-carboxylate reductase [Thermodesulfovibrionales bacterium]|nr:pyrroline-5-carboxylate reductase [Thermodesulfovibrionales bacterium]
MIGFIGGGNMAEAIIKGILKGHKFKKEDIIVSEPRDERRQHLEKTFGIVTTNNNKYIVSKSSIIILAVKPQNMDDVIKEIEGTVKESQTIVSIAAGIRLSYLKEKLKTSNIIRVMPNTPALVLESMSVITADSLSEEQLKPVNEIFLSIGKVIYLSEKEMDAVTALSGSGPAFIAYFIECLIKAAVKLGLTEEVSTLLATQTLTGTCCLLQSGMPPNKVLQMVTSPGGTTEAGLKKLKEREFEEIMAETLTAAFNRSRELGGK